MCDTVVSLSGPADAVHLLWGFSVVPKSLFALRDQDLPELCISTDGIDTSSWQWINHFLTLEIQDSAVGINLLCATQSATHPTLHKLVMQNTEEKLASVVCHKLTEPQTQKKGEKNIKQAKYFSNYQQ